MVVVVYILVDRIHKRPGILLAPHLDPARYVEEAGTRGVRIRHDHLALVDGLGQVLPGRRHRHVLLLRLDRVEADHGGIGALADPERRGCRVEHAGFGLVDALWRYGLGRVLFWW